MALSMTPISSIATDEVVMIVDAPIDGFGNYAFDFSDFEFI